MKTSSSTCSCREYLSIFGRMVYRSSRRWPGAMLWRHRDTSNDRSVIRLTCSICKQSHVIALDMPGWPPTTAKYNPTGWADPCCLTADWVQLTTDQLNYDHSQVGSSVTDWPMKVACLAIAAMLGRWEALVDPITYARQGTPGILQNIGKHHCTHWHGHKQLITCMPWYADKEMFLL